MVAKSGHHLLQPDAVATLRDTLVPMAQVITPNLPEAGVLLATPEPASLPICSLQCAGCMGLDPDGCC